MTNEDEKHEERELAVGFSPLFKGLQFTRRRKLNEPWPFYSDLKINLMERVKGRPVED